MPCRGLPFVLTLLPRPSAYNSFLRELSYFSDLVTSVYARCLLKKLRPECGDLLCKIWRTRGVFEACSKPPYQVAIFVSKFDPTDGHVEPVVLYLQSLLSRFKDILIQPIVPNHAVVALDIGGSVEKFLC
jgi:hypothetical protein